VSIESSLAWNQKALDRIESSSSEADPDARRAMWATALYYWNQGLSDYPNSLSCRFNRIHALQALGNSFSVMEEARDLLVRLKTEAELWEGNFSEEQKDYNLLVWEPSRLIFEKKSKRKSQDNASLDGYLHWLARWIAHHTGPVFRPETIPFWRLAHTINPKDIKARIAIGTYLLKQGQVEGIHLLSQEIKAKNKLLSQWLDACGKITKKYISSLGDSINSENKTGSVDSVDSKEDELFCPYEGFDLALEPNLNCVTTHVLLVDGRWIESEIDFCRQYLSPGMSVLDIGANIGLYTLLAAKHIGKSGKVFAFEPTSSAFNCLEKTIQKNSLGKNVELLKCAVSDRPGKAYLSVGEDSAFNKIVDRLSGIMNQVEQVDMISLDEWWNATSAHHLDLVKIDVGNSPLPAIRGARKLLESEKPILIVESDGSGYVQEETKELLKSLEYRLYSYNIYLKELVPAHRSVASLNSINLIAVPKERMDELVNKGLLSKKNQRKQ